MADYDDEYELSAEQDDEYELSVNKMDDDDPEMAPVAHRNSYLSDDDPTVSRWRRHYHYWYRRPWHRYRYY